MAIFLRILTAEVLPNLRHLQRATSCLKVTYAVQTLPDDRSPMAKAMDTASRIMAISLEMVVPGLGGYWLDQKLNTEPWLALLGFMLGAVLATLQLIRMTSGAGGHRKSNPPNPPDVTSDQDQTP